MPDGGCTKNFRPAMGVIHQGGGGGGYTRHYSNNAITVVKIVESEVNFRVLHSNDWTILATPLTVKPGISSVLNIFSVRAIFSENFSSVSSVLSSPLDQKKNNNNKILKKTCLPI